MSERSATLPAYLHLLRGNRNFRLLWSAQTVSELGDWLYTVAVFSLLLEFTGAAKSVALAFVLQVLPQFFISPAAGIINDRISRKRVMIFADWTRAAIVACMMLVRGPHLIWFLYTLLFLETLMWALFEPGRTGVVPNIVREGELIAANTLSSTTWSVNFALGAALGGIVSSWLGRDAVFVLDSLSFVASALLISRMRFKEPHVAAAGPVCARDLVDFTPIAEGIRYVRSDRRLLATLFVKGGLGLLGANWVLLPIMGERLFPVRLAGFDAHRAGMLGMSLLLSARGVGAIIGPVLAGYWAGTESARLRIGIVLGFMLAGLAYVALGSAPGLALACLAVIVAHAGGSTVWVFSTTMLQQMTDDKFRGRVFSAEFAFMVLTLAASSYGAGLLVDAGVPVRTVAVVAGVLMLAPAAAWAWAMRLWRVAG